MTRASPKARQRSQTGLPRSTVLGLVKAPVAAPTPAPIAAPASRAPTKAPPTAPTAAPIPAPLRPRSPVVSPQAARANMPATTASLNPTPFMTDLQIDEMRTQQVSCEYGSPRRRVLDCDWRR